MDQGPTLLGRYRVELLVPHYARRKAKTYEQRLQRRFLRFHKMRHSREMGGAEVQAFLAVEQQVSASTQNQALAALLFLNRELLERDVELEGGGARQVHRADLAGGWGRVLLSSLARKYPRANRGWAWQWVLPKQKRWGDPVTSAQGRHHIKPTVVQAGREGGWLPQG